MSDKSEIATRLREQIRTVDKMEFALRLTFPSAEMFLQSEAHCLREWMKDAADALSPQANAEASDG